MKGFGRLDWLLAEIRVDPQRLFALWAISTGLCPKAEDFVTHFGSEWASREVIDSLRAGGFLNSSGEVLYLTPQGEIAITCLDDTTSSTPSPVSEPVSHRNVMKTTNLGIVGCGYWGPNLIRNFHSLFDCRVKVICDLNSQRLKHIHQLYPQVTACLDFERLLEEPEIDAIVIATGVKQHYRMAKASLLAGKHTFVEKPLASTVDECEDLIAIADRNGLILMVNHVFLYSSPVRKIKEIVSSRGIGELKYINARRLNLGLFQKDINVMWDLAPNDIAIVLHVFGEDPIGVDCRGMAHINPPIEDVTFMSLYFGGGRFASIESSWLDPRKVREMILVGSNQMIVYDDVAPQEKIKILDAGVKVADPYDDQYPFSYHYGDIHTPYVKQAEALRSACEHFLDCIREGKRPLTDGRAGASVVKILEAASVSLKERKSMVQLNRSALRESSARKVASKPESLTI